MITWRKHLVNNSFLFHLTSSNAVSGLVKSPLLGDPKFAISDHRVGAVHHLAYVDRIILHARFFFCFFFCGLLLPFHRLLFFLFLSFLLFLLLLLYFFLERPSVCPSVRGHSNSVIFNRISSKFHPNICSSSNTSLVRRTITKTADKMAAAYQFLWTIYLV